VRWEKLKYDDDGERRENEVLSQTQPAGQISGVDPKLQNPKMPTGRM
jgi:hypothetical protein